MPTPGFINIPDANLKAAICEKLGVPTTTNLTADDLKGITSLNANERNISDLKGMEYLINL